MTRPLRVLYIDGVGPFGGASRSLYEAMNAFPPDSVERYFVIQRGTVIDFYGRLGKDVIATRGLTRFDNSRASHYRGVRWIVPLRELAWLPFSILAMLKAKRRWGRVDLIHLNEISEILPGLMAKALFRAPMIVHTRSLQRADGETSKRSRLMYGMLRRYATAIVAIDEGVRATLPADLPVEVIHNSFTPEPSETLDEAYLAQLDALRPTSLKVGFVGNLHRHKGMAELFEAAKLVIAEGYDVQFIVVGGTTAEDKGLNWWILHKLGLAQNMQAELHQAVVDAGLEADFKLLGATKDIQRIYQRMDVITFPSYFDAPGRPVFEAAFYGVPSIVAVRNPRPDTVIDGETAIAIPEPDPRALADAIIHFARSRDEVRRMGANAKVLAEKNFVPRKNAAKLLELYRRVAG
jgi:glycosyltransferase involved in cell wall biosynthesis